MAECIMQVLQWLAPHLRTGLREIRDKTVFHFHRTCVYMYIPQAIEYHAAYVV